MSRPSARSINAVHCVECGHRWEPAGGAQGQTLPSCPLCALRLERDRAVELLSRCRGALEYLRAMAANPMKSWDAGHVIDAQRVDEIAEEILDALAQEPPK